MKRIVIFIAVILIIITAISAFKNQIVEAVFVKAIKQMTGLDVGVSGVKINLIKSWINIDGLNIYNPRQFEDIVMAEIPNIFIDYDLAAFLKGRVHLEKVRINLKKILVVRGSDGRLNINSIKGLSVSSQGVSRGSSSGVKDAKRPAPKMQLDLLELKIGGAAYKDFTYQPVLIDEYPLNIDDRYENVTDIEAIVKLVVTRALVNTAIYKIANLDFDKIKKEGIKNVLDTVKGEFKNIFLKESR